MSSHIIVLVNPPMAHSLTNCGFRTMDTGRGGPMMGLDSPACGGSAFMFVTTSSQKIEFDVG
jgi:hypothetical protein